jgi:hypothetical protein
MEKEVAVWKVMNEYGMKLPAYVTAYFDDVVAAHPELVVYVWCVRQRWADIADQFYPDLFLTRAYVHNVARRGLPPPARFQWCPCWTQSPELCVLHEVRSPGPPFRTG